MGDELETTLTSSTGSARMDAALRRLIESCQQALPCRLGSVYVTGSFADGSGLASSDLDVTLVFRDRFASADERATAEHIIAAASARDDVDGVELDAGVVDEVELAEGAPPLLRLGGRCVWGEDHLDALPLMPIERWARERMHAAYWLIANVFRRPAMPVSLPLSYPEPSDDFFGYTRRVVRLPNGAEAPSTRDLIRVTGWAATALVAFKGGAYVARKRECPRAYAQHVGDEHTALHEDIYHWCRQEWGYLIPSDDASRERLRDICTRTLAFENRFLTEYREWVLGELRSGGKEAQHAAHWMLRQVPLMDAAVMQAGQIAMQSGCQGADSVQHRASEVPRT
jgi:predicted nucleotidyltransferase